MFADDDSLEIMETLQIKHDINVTSTFILFPSH